MKIKNGVYKDLPVCRFCWHERPIHASHASNPKIAGMTKTLFPGHTPTLN